MPARNSSRKSRDVAQRGDVHAHAAQPVMPVTRCDAGTARGRCGAAGLVEPLTRIRAPWRGTLVMLRTFGLVVADRGRRRTPRTPRAAPRRPPSARSRRRCSGGRRRRTGSRCWWAGSGRGTARAGRPRGPGGCPRAGGRAGSTARPWCPRGRSSPPIVAGFIRVRTTIGITGCSRIDSFSTASRQSSSPSRGSRRARASSSGSRPSS